MATNFLEQLVAEWYEFQGYFVRRNVRVGRRPKGGHDGELDVVAYKPETNHLIHIEPSMDADRWEQREARYRRKFETGKKHIPELFSGLVLPENIEQVALFVFGSGERHPVVGGGKVVMISEFMERIRKELTGRSVAKAAVPEQFVILRALQFAENYWQYQDKKTEIGRGAKTKTRQ